MAQTKLQLSTLAWLTLPDASVVMQLSIVEATAAGREDVC